MGSGTVPRTSEATTLKPDLFLEFCSSSDPRFYEIRKTHYIASLSFEEGRTLTPAERIEKGLKFGGRGQQIHFLIWYKGELSGIISGGGAVKCTQARDEFFHVANSSMRHKNTRPLW